MPLYIIDYVRDSRRIPNRNVRSVYADNTIVFNILSVLVVIFVPPLVRDLNRYKNVPFRARSSISMYRSSSPLPAVYSYRYPSWFAFSKPSPSTSNGWPRFSNEPVDSVFNKDILGKFVYPNVLRPKVRRINTCITTRARTRRKLNDRRI